MKHYYVKKVVISRLKDWGIRLIQESATPAVLVGIRQGPGVAGQMVVCGVVDLSNEDLAAYLERVAAALRAAGLPQESGRYEVDIK